jgi:hypothetical protein
MNGSRATVRAHSPELSRRKSTPHFFDDRAVLAAVDDTRERGEISKEASIVHKEPLASGVVC